MRKDIALFDLKKCLKIPKGLSESVNQRRTDKTMAKTKRTNNDLLNTTQKTPLKTGVNSCDPEG